jgi:PAS domain S-box-containing protein
MDRMVKNSFDGIIITDHDSIIQIVNQAALDILGCPNEEAVGHLLDVVLPDAVNLTAGLLPLWAPDDIDEQLAPRELSVMRRAGDRIEIELTIGMVNLTHGRRRSSDAALNYHTFTFRDISERKRVQHAEKRATEEALAASRAKTEFLHNMSHELRTPLNAIIGFSEIIQSEVFGPISPPRYLEYIEDILGSGTDLLAIINDVLDVSRIELGQYEVEKDILDPHDVLDSSIRIATGWLNYGERQFQTDVPDALPSIEGDSHVLRQAVINLLSNAFKFSHPDDRIVLRAFIDGDGWLAISVSDTGIGIAPDHLPKVTEAYYQVESDLTRQYEGTGVGLFLSASIVELHDGEMRIDSEPDQGTTVTIRLPSIPDQQEESPPKAATVVAPTQQPPSASTWLSSSK